MPDELNDPLISIPEAAKIIGVNRTTLGRQVRGGAVRSHDGKVRLSEVLQDREANIDLTRSKRHDGKIDADVKTVAFEEDGGAEPVLVDGEILSYPEARALKETYLARLRRLEFETKAGKFVEIEEVGRQVEDEYNIVRERLLTIPGKIAEALVGATRAEIEMAIRAEITEALEELHNPGAR